MRVALYSASSRCAHPSVVYRNFSRGNPDRGSVKRATSVRGSGRKLGRAPQLPGPRERAEPLPTDRSKRLVLSTTADHALRAVLYLAQQADDRAISADQIAEALGAPRNYLSKTLYVLAKEGILEATPGRYGGYRLSISADRLTIAHIVHVFDAPNHRSRCLLGNRPCEPTRPCSAHNQWTRITQASARALEATTISDLLSDDSRR